jgi:acyl carrier protein
MIEEKMNEIKALFAEKLGMKKVDETKSLKDLGLDSLDVVELCLDLEDRYGVAFETEKFAEIKTVADLYSVIEAKLKELEA